MELISTCVEEDDHNEDISLLYLIQIVRSFYI